MPRTHVTIRWNMRPATIAVNAATRSRQAVIKAAYDVENYAKRIVPVDTGNLKNSIQTEITGDFTATVGPRVANFQEVYYAPFIEYGTSRMAARPYMRPSAEHVRQSLIDALHQIVED